MWGGTEKPVKTIHAAVERGVNLIDTAPAYGLGHSEEIVGRAIAKGQLRSRAVIASKVGLEWKDGKVFRNASRDRILRAPTTSTSIKSIGQIRGCRSKRLPKQCRRSSTRERFAPLA